MTVRTRFAPSPTGYLHIGGARTALFCWLYARGHGGRFILRVEDTDRERSTAEAVQAILDGLRWLGLDWDEGPFFQTQRFDRYREVVQQLLEADQAYLCYCTREELEAMRAEQAKRGEKPRYDGRCRERTEPRPGVEPVVRFRTPLAGTTEVDDLVRGHVVFDNRELDDLIIARSDGSPTYNFTVVVDDLDMQVSHVIRGDDHLNNTPKQILIFNALHSKPPVYAHLPMILGPDGAKLSKRHGAVSVLQYREDGYLPEALVNYLVRLGWSHGDQEIFSREEMVALFDIADVNRSAAAINPGKLEWLNQHYLKAKPAADLVEEFAWHLQRLGVEPGVDADWLARIVTAQRERSSTLKEMAEASLLFFRAPAEYEAKAAEKYLDRNGATVLSAALLRLDALDVWCREGLHSTVTRLADERGVKLGAIAQPIRVAVAGRPVSPPIDETLAILGREETHTRLDRAFHFAEAQARVGVDTAEGEKRK